MVELISSPSAVALLVAETVSVTVTESVLSSSVVVCWPIYT